MHYKKSTPGKELWHRWFAWRPVRLEGGGWIIWVVVKRKFVWHWLNYGHKLGGDYTGYYTREYRLP